MSVSSSSSWHSSGSVFFLGVAAGLVLASISSSIAMKEDRQYLKVDGEHVNEREVQTTNGREFDDLDDIEDEDPTDIEDLGDGPNETRVEAEYNDGFGAVGKVGQEQNIDHDNGDEKRKVEENDKEAIIIFKDGLSGISTPSSLIPSHKAEDDLDIRSQDAALSITKNDESESLKDFTENEDHEDDIDGKRKGITEVDNNSLDHTNGTSTSDSSYDASETNHVKSSKDVVPVPRYHGLAIKLKRDEYLRFIEIYDYVWEEVLDRMNLCNIRNFIIYYHEETSILFQHFEWIGHWERCDLSDDETDHLFEEDMKKLANDPVVRKWWAECELCQEPFSQWPVLEKRPSEGGKGNWWAPLKCIAHCGQWPTAYSTKLDDPDFVDLNEN